MNMHDLDHDVISLPYRSCSVPQLRSAILVFLACILLGACEVPTDRDFSASAADALLEELISVHSLDVPIHDNVSCTDTQGGIPPVSGFVARYLVTHLNLSCSVLRWKTTTEREDDVWLTSREAIVAWNREHDWIDVLSITVFFDQRLRGDSLSRVAMAPLAGFLEGLRTFLKGDAVASMRVVVSISPTSDSPVTSDFNPSQRMQYLAPSARYETEVYGSEITIPQVPAGASKSPGWVISVASSRGVLSTLSSEREGSLRTSAGIGVNVEASPDFRFYTAYRPESAGKRVTAPEHHGQQLLRALQAIPVSGTDRTPSSLVRMLADICRSTYWGAGVLIPLFFLGIAVRVVMIESSAMVDYLQRQINRLDKTENRLSNRIAVRRTKILAIEIPVKGGEGIEESRVPIGKLRRLKSRWDGWRRRRLQRYIDRTEGHLRSTERKLLVCCGQWPYWRDRKERTAKRLGKLGSGAWEAVLEEAGGRRGVMSMAMGAVAVLVSFAALYYSPLEWLRPTLSAPIPHYVVAPITVLAIFGVCLALAMGMVRVFSLGAAFVCLIGLDTIELSPFATIGAQVPLNDLYDSQTVTLMFTCFILLIGIQEAMLHARKAETTKENWLNEAIPASDAAVVSTARANAKRKERFWSTGLGAVYFVLVLHTLCPALGEIMMGNSQRPGLMAVTVITAATLLVPLLPLARIVKTDGGGRQRECSRTTDTDAIVAKVQLQNGECDEGGIAGND